VSSLTWGRKQIQFPKRCFFSLVFRKIRTMDKVRKPNISVRTNPVSFPRTYSHVRVHTHVVRREEPLRREVHNKRKNTRPQTWTKSWNVKFSVFICRTMWKKSQFECLWPILHQRYQYGSYIRNAFIKLKLFQGGSRSELVTLFIPKFFSNS
jgi:hypothetical protein